MPKLDPAVKCMISKNCFEMVSISLYEDVIFEMYQSWIGNLRQYSVPQYDTNKLERLPQALMIFLSLLSSIYLLK